MKIIILKLLADRFQLKFHREKRELPVYAITVVNRCKRYEGSVGPKWPGLFFGGAAPEVAFRVTNVTFAEVGATLRRSILDKPSRPHMALSCDG